MCNKCHSTLCLSKIKLNLTLIPPVPQAGGEFNLGVIEALLPRFEQGPGGSYEAKGASLLEGSHVPGSGSGPCWVEEVQEEEISRKAGGTRTTDCRTSTCCPKTRATGEAGAGGGYASFLGQRVHTPTCSAIWSSICPSIHLVIPQIRMGFLLHATPTHAGPRGYAAEGNRPTPRLSRAHQLARKQTVSKPPRRCIITNGNKCFQAKSRKPHAQG